MIEELKPCPFYNHNMPIIQFRGRSKFGGMRWVVMCGTCGCEGQKGTTEAEAAKYWNVRAYEVREESHEKMQEAISEYIKYRKGAVAIKKAIKACFEKIDSALTYDYTADKNIKERA